MAFLLGRSTRGGGGHCFQIGDDRVDLGAFEVMLEGGMRGVPSLMRPRMNSSLPPAVALDHRGPEGGALICGGRWQIPQDGAKTCRPNFCVAVNPSSVAACCAEASPAASTPKSSTPERMAERIAALRFILNPPDIFFLQPYARA